LHSNGSTCTATQRLEDAGVVMMRVNYEDLIANSVKVGLCSR
jgi:hypothetical protein